MEENKSGLGLMADLDKVKPYTFNLEAHKAALHQLINGKKKVRMVWNGKLKRYVEYKSKR